MITDQKRLKLFMETRNELIERLDRKEITKEDFIRKNIQCIEHHGMKPYVKIENIDQGLYNYHYYNLLAKHHNNIAIACRKDRRGRKKQKLEFNRRDNYYRQKDQVIFQILELVDDGEIEAYFIQLDSKRLGNELIEIVLKNYDKAILHSLDRKIYQYLKKRRHFTEGLRRSKIHDYVNKPY